MHKLIEPFVVAPIASQQAEEDMIYYYDKAGQLLAEVYHHDGQFCSATFYGEYEHPPISKQELEALMKQVQHVFGLDHLVVESIEQEDSGWMINLKLQEPRFNVTVPGSGMTIAISDTGFVHAVTVNDNNFKILYPDMFISKEEARAILKEQLILTLGIAPELGWQYVYKQNYDLYGINPNGKVRLWSEDETMQDAGFEPLPQVEAIEDFEAFLKGNRDVVIEKVHLEEEKRWAMETEEQVYLEEKAFVRACQVVKHLVGDAYQDYYIEQYPTLRKLLHMEEHAFVTFRFVYIYEGIPFDFQAIAISVDTETNQIASVKYPIIPYETFPTLQKPTLTVKEANDIAKNLIDVELILENDLVDHKKRSFVYVMDYPTSPTGGHIQYIDGFTGEIHWVNTGW